MFLNSFIQALYRLSLTVAYTYAQILSLSIGY